MHESCLVQTCTISILNNIFIRVVRYRKKNNLGGGGRLTEKENFFLICKIHMFFFGQEKAGFFFKFRTQKNLLFIFWDLSDLSHFSETLTPNENKNRTLILKIKWSVPFV